MKEILNKFISFFKEESKTPILFRLNRNDKELILEFYSLVDRYGDNYIGLPYEELIIEVDNGIRRFKSSTEHIYFNCTKDFYTYLFYKNNEKAKFEYLKTFLINTNEH
jgi:hypothetical protein